jgi:Tfp pilus assembly protein PilF
MRLLCCHLLAACAAQAPLPLPAPATLLHDETFAPPSRPIDPAQVFAVSAAMQHLLDSAPPTATQAADPRRHLIELLYGPRQLVLEYDSTLTRTASQAYAAHSGNCLSLVIMTAAFAKAAGLPVEYRQVMVEDAWSRDGGLFFASGHVHLALGWPLARGSFGPGHREALVIDFLPAAELQGLRTRPISEATVMAMFMNNRAAEVLASGAVGEAYWWARQALLQDSSFLPAYNTLGVVYTRAGQRRWAQALFETVLARDPENTKVMGNLVGLLQAEGRSEEARPWAERLSRLEPYPPFHFLQAGQAAMQQQNWRSARDLFRQEAARQPFNPEVHFWLAQAHYRLGNWREADKQLELARLNSSTPQEHALYAAKLGWLRAFGERSSVTQ